MVVCLSESFKGRFFNNVAKVCITSRQLCCSWVPGRMDSGTDVVFPVLRISKLVNQELYSVR